ncbi:sensor histidine kinase [Massilia pseudoviolaceinigra]|uniref:sensor histidine kinase n=1 Tax=Massilia pseudoviolaceinigra TaxID=3057165 RepID=UPI002796D217|nr:histidine kinase [Massilia sp. CCM 9206]MDQ1918941.1 histidine kinase [Massilia sp. CCM 9206]
MRLQRSTTVIGVAWLLFWALMVSVAVEDYLRDGGKTLWQPVLWESSSMLAATSLLALQRRLTRNYDHLLATPWRWFGLQALFLPMYWMAFVPIAFGIRHGVYALAGARYEHAAWGPTFFYESLKLSVFVGLFVVIVFGILSYQQLLEAKLRAEKANALLREAHLQRLRQQMQPHFLFNALNTISSLMHTDVMRADATLIELADVLRATLDVGELQVAPLSTELRLVRGYARVMQERYAERVTIDWRIDDEVLACPVPVMSIQPLLENIFKHTVEKRRETAHIAISASRRDGMLVVTLDDDIGTLAPDAPPGVGLSNLRERMAALYGERASLALSPLAPAGVRVEMRVPCAS